MGTNTATDGDTHRTPSLRTRTRALLTSTLRWVRARLRSLFISDWAVLVVTTAVAAAVAATVAPGGGVVVVGLGVAIATGIVLATRKHTVWRFVAGAAVVVGGLCVAALFGVTAFSVLESGLSGLLIGIVLLSLAIAVTGACLTPLHAVSAAKVGRTAVLTVLTAAGVLVVLLARILPEGALRTEARAAAVAVVGDVLDAFLSPQPTFAVAIVCLLGFGAAYGSRWAIGTLRIERYLPADRRGVATAFQRIVRTVSSWIGKITFLLLVFYVLLTVAWATGIGEASPPVATLVALRSATTLVAVLPAPAAGPVGWLLFSPIFRIGLVAVILGSLGVVTGKFALRRLFGRTGLTLVRTLVPVGAGVVLGVGTGTVVGDATLGEQLAAGLPGWTPPAVADLVLELPLFAVAQVLLLLAIGLYLCVLIGLLLLRATAGLPKRTGGPALASLGLCVAAVCAVVLGHFALGLVTIAAGFAVWDIGEFGVTLREDLPSGTSTFRPEAFHTIGAGTLAVGAAVTAAVAERYLFSTVATSSPTAAIIGVVALGTVGTVVALVAS